VVDNWYLWGVKHDIAPAYPAIYGTVADPALSAPVAPVAIGEKK
jgi:photosynthetic reaction center M subunit